MLKKKTIDVWNDKRVRKWWQHFHFWGNYSFCSYCVQQKKGSHMDLKKH